ncbi:hypothetical protein CYMTET_22972 [Cymbomonas tetramitiformis]|uniref:MYND-type domain-containing protein n=1 Tax=Cymbomonas tetramitiformis TaxID=36881 RepID=A0AAE0L1R9_9CHLO|nr:hypothetical protein CYMTET_22972 [Cymbomonas tetramitiformis]
MPRVKAPCDFPECEEEWTTLRCAKCRKARYCCADHQKKHWKIHRQECEDVGGQGEWSSSGQRVLAPEVGRSPEVWDFKPVPEHSHRFDPSKPAEIGWDWRGEKKCRAEFAEIRKGTREWVYRDTTEQLARNLSLHEKECRRLHVLRNEVEKLLACVELRGVEAVEESDLTSLQALGDTEEGRSIGLGAAYRMDASGKWGPMGPIEVDASNLLGLTLSQLRQKITDLASMCQVEEEAVEGTRRDIHNRHQWDTYESGHETRDMLENGVRRAHMEARLGRIAGREDIQKSLQIPFHLRPKVIGHDPNPATVAGNEVPFTLPYKEAPEDQRP